MIDAMKLTNPIVLLILDGWGLLESGKEGNAIEQANLTCWPHLLATYPHLALEAHGVAVGLPEGQAGNSEVGHLTLGAGKTPPSYLSQADASIEDKSLKNSETLNALFEHCKTHNSTLHLAGLLSDGGVHSHINHLLNLLIYANEADVPKVKIHIFTDGRDVAPGEAEAYIEALEQLLLDLNYPQIATTVGRYFAMDRDQRWDRIEQAFRCIAFGEGQRHFLSLQALDFYRRKEESKSEEFLLPCVTDITYDGLHAHDALFFFNFRADRMRQLTQVFTDKTFTHFPVGSLPEGLKIASLAPYGKQFNYPTVLPAIHIEETLGSVLSQHKLRQLRIAETEKAAHVTYFFNGGKEEPSPLESRTLLASPSVTCYSETPAMRTEEIMKTIIEALESKQYDVIIANIAAPDMLGHTGNLNAAIEAVKAVDNALTEFEAAILNADALALITADHGNIEAMLTEQGKPNTAHTCNPVPLVLLGNSDKLSQYHWTETQGKLSQIAPTLLTLLGLNGEAKGMDETLLKLCSTSLEKKSLISSI
jgi:2,3-bisphosphoglycerate-independent phosphoglycerate mutase